METVKETLSDWTLINSRKRLNGAYLHCARILNRSGRNIDAEAVLRQSKRLPDRKMTKEEINGYLFSLSMFLNLI